jgi:hypothetical protein
MAVETAIGKGGFQHEKKRRVVFDYKEAGTHTWKQLHYRSRTVSAAVELFRTRRLHSLKTTLFHSGMKIDRSRQQVTRFTAASFLTFVNSLFTISFKLWLLLVVALAETGRGRLIVSC